MTDKIKWSDQGTHRSREDSPDAESGRKKPNDKDRQPTGTIVVKQSKILKLKGNTKYVKQPEAEPKIGQAQPKGKGKEKAVEIAEPMRGHRQLKANAEEYTPLCKRCIGESCLVVVGRKGQAIKSCAKCHFMKVWCNQLVLVNTRGPSTTQAPKSHPQSKAAPASKSKAQSQTTRATSRVRPPTPILESEDTVEDTEASVTNYDDAEIDHDTDAERHTDITTEMSVDPDDQIMVDQPAAIASAADFSANHWVENTDDMPIPIPPTNSCSQPSFPSFSTFVTAMQMADKNALARVNAMEQEFDTHISSMCAELSSMQLDVGATVTLVNRLVSLVEKLQQEWVLTNPSFSPPILSHGDDFSATTFGMRYLNGVFGPLVAPIPLSIGVSQTSASCPSGHPDMQGGTFTSE
ncbi:uncharacterized protein HD556DRAFT_1452297 [Suillus plorans]|uniref:Uncharacterized protein n=1 Tax=Suillus plorans TaxID=116603 RepID=A0A9P7E2Q2_9AGAM|nr:uncharacterized protein HD556DRAFT_1452297 [Suillus plorans]KAG1809845.1 hypothetical protein HD556DRAFT_1452297 [Suillus plorans]